jgi:hypothetical protein
MAILKCVVYARDKRNGTESERRIALSTLHLTTFRLDQCVGYVSRYAVTEPCGSRIPYRASADNTRARLLVHRRISTQRQRYAVAVDQFPDENRFVSLRSNQVTFLFLHRKGVSLRRKEKVCHSEEKVNRKISFRKKSIYFCPGFGRGVLRLLSCSTAYSLEATLDHVEEAHQRF